MKRLSSITQCSHHYKISQFKTLISISLKFDPNFVPKMASRYSSYESSRSSSSSSSSELKKPKKIQSLGKKEQNLDSVMERRSKGANFRVEREELGPKGSSFMGFDKKGVVVRNGDKGVVGEVRANSRTLAMVLRSERELLSQNKEYEMEVLELKMVIEEKNDEVEKLKDLCLKLREEIKSLKNAILFPDVMNIQLQEIFQKQGLELKQAKQVIPTLQRQVTSLTGQLQCFTEDLAEVKADKHAARSSYKGYIGSPRTPAINHEAANSLEYSSENTVTAGSSEDMILKDFNPCLTPYFAKDKSMEFDGMPDYGSPDDDWLFDSNGKECGNNCLSPQDEKEAKSSQYIPRRSAIAHAACRPDEKMYSSREPMHHQHF